MTRTSSIFLAAALGALLSGCSTIYQRVDPGIEFEDVSFKAQTTHYHDVLEALGPPNRMTASGDGFAFLYESMLIRELQTGIGGRNGWWQLFKISIADSKLFRDSMILRFDHEGALVAQSVSHTREGLGKSGAVQPILAVRQIVDTDDYEDDAIESLGWGSMMLRSLPRTLNANQSLHSGAAGLEQSGTSPYVGQHALEMRY